MRAMVEKYREYRSLYGAGRLRYALYALHDGVEAALKLLAEGVGIPGYWPDTRFTAGEVARILGEREILTARELGWVHTVIEIRNKYKHRELRREPREAEIYRAAEAYLELMDWFKRRYAGLAGGPAK